jgi:tetratricopeptide (TPR) repeat protein
MVTAAPTPYGHDFVRAGQGWADAAPPRLPVQTAPAEAQNEQEYLRQMEALEKNGGPYNDSLAEPLMALANIHRQKGDWEAALSLYRQALQVVRINDGLYSQRQVPLLRAQLDTYRMAGEMQALDRRYQYFFRLYGRGEPPYTELRVRASLEFMRWQREWIRLELDSREKNRRRLLDLYRLNEQLIEGISAQAGIDDSWYQSMVMSQLRNLYLIRDQVEPQVEYVGAAPTGSIPGNNWNEKDTYTLRLEGLQRGALSNGARLLNTLIARDSSAPLGRKARWHVELGDWYQWNDNSRRAKQYYREAWQLLQQAGQGKQLREWLGRPVELPDNGAFWQPRTDGDGPKRVVVTARFDVSESGRARNLQTTPAREEEQSAASRLRRELSKTRFRPRFISGQAEETLGVARDYEVVK